MKSPKIAAAAAGTALIIAGGVTAAVVAIGSAAPARAAVTHFDATYYEGNSIWTCSGTHTITKTGAKESETCLITGDTTGYARMVGTHTGLPAFHLPGSRPGSPPVRWHSDYNHVLAASWTITFKNTHHIGFSGLDTYQAHVTAFYDS
jgi:hypothetical protein